MTMQPRTTIIGGGAAGFFCGIQLKTMCPRMEVCICESGRHVLRKVAVSGGGRCNVTNTFEGVSDLQAVYPRGHRLMKRLFNVFSPQDTYRWFEEHGVPLTVQPDHCVFPQAQDAQAVISCFLRETRRLGVEIRTECRIDSLPSPADHEYVVVTTGGVQPSSHLLPPSFLVQRPVPSLYSFRIDDEQLHALMGTVVEQAHVLLPGTKLKAEGPLLLTHWGMSGPAVLRLSSYGARLLAEKGYRHPLSVNWAGQGSATVQQELSRLSADSPQKLLPNLRPFGLPARLWEYLTQKALGERSRAPWGSLNRKELNRLLNTLTNDEYLVSGRAPFKDEFVTCGGVDLKSVNPATLESRERPRLFFAGEVLDVDGVTGGFNFQCAWTTAFVVAQSIARSEGELGE